MYSRSIKQIEDDIQDIMKKVNELTGIKESDTGLAPPALWDLTADKHTLHSQFIPCYHKIPTNHVLMFNQIKPKIEYDHVMWS